MQNHNRYSQRTLFPSDQNGSALLACVAVLVVLTTLGILAIQTSITETKISANEQRWEQDFNIAEGGAGMEASHVGFAREGAFEWYQIVDPDAYNQLIVPPDSASYDPGGDLEVTGNFPDDFLATLPDGISKRRMWPRQNIRLDTADDDLDYAYLVTYLGTSEKGVKGSNAAGFSFYQFRFNSARQVGVEIELGGVKIGPKHL